jgi:hypothetical protein
MRRLSVAVGLLLLSILPVGVASSPALASSFNLNAQGVWVSSDGLLSGTWQAHFDVAGFDLTGTLDVLGLPGVGEGNIAGSWDLNQVGFGVLFLNQELASFTGGVQGDQLVGTFETGDIIGNWSGALSSLSFTNNPITPIINATIPTLLLSHTDGNLGDLVQLAATLYTLGAPIKQIENSIIFDAATAIAANALGKPDCSVNPFISKADSLFEFLPNGCSGSTCTQVRAIVKSLTNNFEIPDGATVYTCKARIAQGAAAGAYQLIVNALKAFDIDSLPLPIAAIAGEILAKQPLLKQLKKGCHCATVETAGPLPLPSLLAPLLLVMLRRRERNRSSIRSQRIPVDAS